MYFLLVYCMMVAMIVMNTAFVMHYFGVKKVQKEKILKSSIVIGVFWPIILSTIVLVFCISLASFTLNRIRNRG